MIVHWGPLLKKQRLYIKHNYLIHGCQIFTVCDFAQISWDLRSLALSLETFRHPKCDLPNHTFFRDVAQFQPSATGSQETTCENWIVTFSQMDRKDAGWCRLLSSFNFHLVRDGYLCRLFEMPPQAILIVFSMWAPGCHIVLAWNTRSYGLSPVNRPGFSLNPGFWGINFVCLICSHLIPASPSLLVLRCLPDGDMSPVALISIPLLA